jgi:putative Mg2+ transporter-C (MgtC) family protein
MLTIEQMLFRLVVALILGALLGAERELVKKNAGVRTEMLVAGGASLFAMIGLALPYVTSVAIGTTPDLATVNAGLAIIANVVIGIGFLGAGLIVKTATHPHGVTTAAEVWATAAIGVLVGIGLISFAVAATFIILILLYGLRKFNVSKEIEKNAEHLPAKKKG